MRIVINATASLGVKTGVGHYTAELIRTLQKHPDLNVTSFPPDFLARPFSVAQRGGTAPGGTGGKSSPLRGWMKQQARSSFRLGWRAVLNSAARVLITKDRYDLYHEPNFVPLPSRVPTVVTVHDLSPVLHPEWHPADRVSYFKHYFEPRVRLMDHILTDSESARQELIDTYNLPPERITRTYMGIREHLRPATKDEIERTRQQLGFPKNYLLHVGTVEPRKNLLLLMKAYCALPPEVREQAPLILAGKWGWQSREAQEFFEKTARHQGVVQVGYLPEESLAAVYSGALALVFPTFYEGFGLPAAEMLGCGGAVIASTAGAVAEVVGTCGVQLAPNDFDGWRLAMLRAILEPDWLEELKQGATERAQLFTWDKCAEETIAAYRKTLGIQAIIAKAA
jgi:glycosyltransferase involved in cell wall biosynthesis